MKLRRFTTPGIEQFRNFLQQLRNDPHLGIPVALLHDATASEALSVDVEVEYHPFSTRLDLAKYLDQLLTNKGLENLEQDVGLWSWLTLFFLGQLCPKGKKVGVEAAYIPMVGVSTRYYRHLLLGPYVMYRVYRKDPDKLHVLLSSPVNIGNSETYRLFIENPTLIACPAVLATANVLYYDYAKGKLKRGAGSKDAGGCRRLIDYLQQIDCTYDLPMLSEQQLTTMLPKEFQKLLGKGSGRLF
jgi:hypothetical protein